MRFSFYWSINGKTRPNESQNARKFSTYYIRKILVNHLRFVALLLRRKYISNKFNIKFTTQKRPYVVKLLKNVQNGLLLVSHVQLTNTWPSTRKPRTWREVFSACHTIEWNYLLYHLLWNSLPVPWKYFSPVIDTYLQHLEKFHWKYLKDFGKAKWFM